MSNYRRASCSECPSTFELVPPTDKDYSVPILKRNKRDCIERHYECEEGHRNKMYWEESNKGKSLAAIVDHEYSLRPEPSKCGEGTGLIVNCESILKLKTSITFNPEICFTTSE
jgi:hypothetical protein